MLIVRKDGKQVIKLTDFGTSRVRIDANNHVIREKTTTDSPDYEIFKIMVT